MAPLPIDATDVNVTNGHSLPGSHVGTNGNGTEAASQVPIAICGMSVRLPGGLHSPQELWDFLVSKGDARGPVPRTRYNVSAHHSQRPKPGTVNTQYGYFLDESVDISTIDTSFFNMNQIEVGLADPQQRQMLEVARECMEDAGETQWKGRPIGCYMGSFGDDWVELFAKDNQQPGMYRITGTGDFMLPNRVSYEMNLMGPSMVIRTGCSASLIALHEACMAISRGDCEGAIVGGANLIMGPGMSAAASEQGALSPDGSCKTFSVDANGFARAEAISAIFIKTLSQALHDGNPVRAVIRGTASNSNGRSNGGFQVPNGVAQEALIRRTYQVAGITDLSETAFVEYHGTGTPVGDPIEARAVGRVFGPTGGIQIGSVKANLGHSEGASGLTSIIKAVMALENRIIPPNIKLNIPNPDIPWKSCGLSVPTEPVPWPEQRKERISVNSFGIGGTNAHVVLDSALSYGILPPPKRPLMSPELLVYSANSTEALQQVMCTYKAWAQRNPDRIGDLAFTLANKREHLPYRAFAVANLMGSLTASGLSKSGEPPNVVMVFTGQGAQWPQMGRCMLQSSIYSVFKQRIQSLDTHLQTLSHAPDWGIEDEIKRPSKTSRLVDTFASVGVHPTAVVGHSSGEIAAAYAAGAISAVEAITIAFYRGQVTLLQSRRGSMAAIGMSSEEVQEYLEPGAIVACENSPTSVTLSGDANIVDLVVSRIKNAQPGILAKLLQVDKAYHSDHMLEIGQDYRALIDPGLSAIAPKKLFFSSVTGMQLSSSDCDLGAQYWQRNLESPVLFHSAVSSIMQHDISRNMILLEIGPHSALSGPLRQTQKQHSSSCPYVSALVRNQNDVESFLTAIGALHSFKVPVGLSKVISEGSCLRDLPRYPWDHSQKFWHESRLSKEWRHQEHAYHDLLGVRVADSPDFNVLFRNVFHLDNAPWVRDHRVGEDIVFPLVGYVGMIGEAIRQVTGVDEAFILRNIIIHTALVLSGGHPVEITTTLRRHHLTDSLESEWWEFAIASHNGTTWTKHCSGDVKGTHRRSPGKERRNDPLLRKVTSERCYDCMARCGFDFGPAFRRLDDVRSDTLTTNATAAVAAREEDNIGYLAHPTTIDASLQLLSIAASKGCVNTSDKLMVPTTIEEMCIYRCSENVQMRAVASYTPEGGIVGSAQGVAADGSVLLRSSGVRLSVLDEQQSIEQRGEATARTEWGPHIDFIDPQGLMKSSMDRSMQMQALEILSRLCMVHSKRTMEILDTSLEHMHKYRSWINRECQQDELQHYHSLDNTTIELQITSIVDELSQTPAAGSAVGISKLYRNMKDIFTGEVEALGVLLTDDTLAKIHAYGDQCDESQLFKHLAHSKPNLRILEIGAGTGATTANVLEMLTPGERTLYSKYTFSDISSGFFVAARERFRAYANIEYLPLDISHDPSEQGFDGRKYDLIITTNVIHATRSLNETLCNIRKLISPNGRLLLHELTPASRWVNYVWGTLAGWWYGEADGRPDQPYVSVERWTRELKAAGFCAPDAAVPDSAAPHQLNTMILARPVIEERPKKKVTLLSTVQSKNVTSVAQSLEGRGYAIDHRGLQGPVPIRQDVIVLLDDDGPFFEDMSDQRLESFKALVSQLKDCGVFWVTSLLQIQCQDSRFAPILGMARVMRSEMLIDFATCEVDNVSSSTSRIIDVFEKFQVRQTDDIIRPDFEYAIVQNTVQVGRIHCVSVQNELLESRANDSISLQSSKLGRLTALQWVRQDVEPPKDGDVEVEIHATGLNYKDILVSMGIVKNPVAGFGLEAAGVILRTGSNVTGLKPGDRVMLCSDGSFATRRVVLEDLCVKIPSGLSFEDAATMPCVFATSIYSIFNIGNLKRGQSILIHSACGGVGLATIQLAQMAGADIYTTVGSQEKINYLMDTFKLLRNRIFNSRTDAFVEDIMRETNNRGVDLALNSLSGELLHSTWKCVAPFGKMIEIGKRDLIGAGKLDMKPFGDNRSYCCVGFDQQGIHLGKIVVSMRDAAGQCTLDENVMQKRKVTRFDNSAAYLLVGGLGGLGRAISIWMVERGARHLIYLSRSAGTTKVHMEFFEELASMGCRADFVRGTVSEAGDVAAAMELAHGHLKGILQMSMVLRDNSFPHMTKDEWDTVVDPKVKGTWNLHNSSISIHADLEFFVLFSSISGNVGQPGQINYACANTFMDAFAEYRLNQGLPACAIQIGAVTEVGFLAENNAVMQRVKHTGSENLVSRQEFLDALQAAMNPATRNFCLGIRPNLSLNNSGSHSIYKGDIRMAVFHNGEDAGSVARGGSSDALKSFIARAKADEYLLGQSASAHFLAQEIGKKVFSFLLKPEEDLRTSCSLSDLGLDSLVAIEVRQWWKSAFGFDISVLEMMGMGSLDELGEHAAKGMLKLFHGDGV
ncbi:hypothetical protein FE257_008672 [Aspergillus nanangensis]|uniref:Carrier domain-containing protein n=1 Tax=Aspergillus nanangensis TaxID=2582783 RepID=A0AAD4CKW2_ASPNN|nr:hypothetical protein FE257_008672 [Aspergillus nanangensis]